MQGGSPFLLGTFPAFIGIPTSLHTYLLLAGTESTLFPGMLQHR